MTDLLKRAIARLQTLPASEQDTIAAMILEEIEDDQRWDESILLLIKYSCKTGGFCNG